MSWFAANVLVDVALHVRTPVSVHILETVDALQLVTELRRKKDSDVTQIDSLHSRYMTEADLFILEWVRDKMNWWNSLFRPSKGFVEDFVSRRRSRLLHAGSSPQLRGLSLNEFVTLRRTAPERVATIFEEDDDSCRA